MRLGWLHLQLSVCIALGESLKAVADGGGSSLAAGIRTGAEWARASA